MPLSTPTTDRPAGSGSHDLGGRRSEGASRTTVALPPENPATGPGQVSSSTRSPGKRRKGWDSDDERSRKQQPRRKPLSPDDTSTRTFFACPFWKLSPSKHRSCFRLTLQNTSRVKQHLARSHAPAYYCECCMTIFTDDHTHRQHVREERTCTPRPPYYLFPGLTHQQQRQLSRKSRPGLSESERWFAIWDIVFPNYPRPSSPFIDANLSEDVCRFQEFALVRGPALVAAQIRADTQAGSDGASGITTEEEADAVLDRAISRGIELMFETWLAERLLPPSADTEAQRTITVTPATTAHSLSSRPSDTSMLFAQNTTPTTSALIPQGSAAQDCHQGDCEVLPAFSEGRIVGTSSQGSPSGLVGREISMQGGFERFGVDDLGHYFSFGDGLESIDMSTLGGTDNLDMLWGGEDLGATSSDLREESDFFLGEAGGDWHIEKV
ncbi:hypothetical protein VTI74DRAFT_9040 [Chaetomium olivicolor]